MAGELVGDLLDRGRLVEVGDGHVLEGATHEVVPRPGRDGAAVDRIDTVDAPQRSGCVGVAHPHRGGERRRVADEPGVAEALGRARLARRRAPDVRRPPGAGRDDTPQHVGHVVGDHLLQHPLGLGLEVVLEHAALGVDHLEHRGCGRLVAAGGEHRVTGRHVEG